VLAHLLAHRAATAAFSTVVALAALAVPGALPAAAVAAPSAASTGATGVIVQMFDWPWPAIGAECTNMLGPDGYAAVQISPPEEAVVLAADGYPWWQAYQTVSYRLDSRFGTEAQLASMISACHAAGVKVYADVVLNHALGLGQADWAPNGLPMTRLNATTWTATIEAAADATLSYKYDLGGSSSNVEETASCGYLANRSMSVNGGTVSDTVAAWAGLGGC
jgi:Alpha amylase, catalytic domain